MAAAPEVPQARGIAFEACPRFWANLGRVDSQGLGDPNIGILARQWRVVWSSVRRWNLSTSWLRACKAYRGRFQLCLHLRQL